MISLPVSTGEGSHVVIVGGGFAGLAAARKLKKAKEVRVTLIDATNYHLFQPLLYQVATGALSPADIASPLRNILRKSDNTTVLMTRVTGIDTDSKRIETSDGYLAYDALILAAGAVTNYFAHPEWVTNAPGLKSIEDAIEIRSKIYAACEAAEESGDRDRQAALLTFVVVGGGPTGVEMSGAISEIVRDLLPKEFHHLDPSLARVLLVEAGPRLLVAMPEVLSDHAKADLEKMGVEIRLSTMVTAIKPGSITVGDETLEAENLIWAAGVKASPLGALLGVEVDRGGRVPVGPTLNLPGHPEIFVVGDVAAITDAAGVKLPGLAPVAIQSGEVAATNIRRLLANEPLDQFTYKDRGSMATIGRNKAVGVVFGRNLDGFDAWVTWLFVHIMMLVGYRNRFAVMTQWGWSYLFRNRPARLITGRSTDPHP